MYLNDAAVGVVLGIEDEGTKVGVWFGFLWWWDFGNDFFEDVVDANAGISRGVDYVGAAEADGVFDFFGDSIGVCVVHG